MDNLQAISTDLQNILGDLDPAIPEPPKTEEKPPNLPTEGVAVDKLITKLQDIQRLSQELLGILQNSGDIIQVPAQTPVSRPVISNAEAPLTENTGFGLAKTLEGRFSGEKMIGDDGHEYNVPPNYASKSKLVTGDRMKLTITPTGAFIYKQIGPIERKRAIGTLKFEPEHNRWTVDTPSGLYRVLPASISFYKGKPGDEVILFVPEHTPAEWGAVDQLIAK